MKEARIPGGPSGGMCQAVSFGHIVPEMDVALLKVDFGANSNKNWLKGRSDFPYLTVSVRELEEGEGVYSFGYPLSSSSFKHSPSVSVGSMLLCPRVTSAIVSSTFFQTKMLITDADPQVYVLDKALNYGNSGGPIVSTDTGRVHALCSRFQPVYVPQEHLKDAAGNCPYIMIPSLYGVVSSLGDRRLRNLFQTLNIPMDSL